MNPLLERDFKYTELNTKSTVKFIYGGSRTKRFHTVDTVRENLVGQHSFGAAMLCHMLTGGICSTNLIMSALCHDLAEKTVGDVPAPTKRALGISTDDLENKALAQHGLTFPLGAPERRVLKMADALDGLMHCALERNSGNWNDEMKLVTARFQSYIMEHSPFDETERRVVDAIFELVGV